MLNVIGEFPIDAFLACLVRVYLHATQRISTSLSAQSGPFRYIALMQALKA